MRKKLGLLLTLAASLCPFSLGQTASHAHPKSPTIEPNFLTVDRVPPPYCEAHLVVIATSDGSSAYRRLQAVSEALATSQDAAENLKRASETLKGSGDLTHLFSNLFGAEQRAIDGLHCAAQVMNAYKQKKENFQDDLTSLSLIIGFNQEAYAVELLRDSQKERFSRQGEPTPALSISDSEKLQKISDLQRDAGSSILDASALAVGSSVDTSGDKNLPVEYSQLSCSENKQIVDALETVAQKIQTIYGQSATTILDVLGKLKCRA